MKVSLDDGKTYQAVDGIRIVYEVDVPGEDDPKGQLHINFTPEGSILDVWATRNESLDHNIGSHSETIVELVEWLVEQSR